MKLYPPASLTLAELYCCLEAIDIDLVLCERLAILVHWCLADVIVPSGLIGKGSVVESFDHDDFTMMPSY